MVPSSKTCSCCGHVLEELKLSERTYVCPCCGMVMDRDHNAAVNIREEGKRIFLKYLKGLILSEQAAAERARNRKKGSRRAA